MIRFSPAPQNKRHGVAVNFSSPRQKLGIPAIKRHNSNKILQKLKNNPIFILLLQNKGVTLQRNQRPPLPFRASPPLWGELAIGRCQDGLEIPKRAKRERKLMANSQSKQNINKLKPQPQRKTTHFTH